MKMRKPKTERKKKKDHNTKIWLIEDDEQSVPKLKLWLKDIIPKARISHFENAGYAAQATGSPDVIILDVAAMSGGTGAAMLCHHNARGLYDLHPGAIFILYSAIGSFAKGLYEELCEEIPDLHWISYFDLEKIEAILG